MNSLSLISLTYNFDYGRFQNFDLQNRAKNTLGDFLIFVRSSFDGLLENGRILQNLYYDCLSSCPNGKKVFEEWLASNDFGASRYLAKSAMEIYRWFEKLSNRMQRLVRRNVQNWSVSALRQLTKVSSDLVQELVRDGSKKTVVQVKQSSENQKEKQENGNVNHEIIGVTQEPNQTSNYSSSKTSPDTKESPPLKTELAPGMRIIVVNDNHWNDHRGIIISEYGNSWWVLLDYAVAQGSTTKHLLKPEQIEIEGINEERNFKDVFTAVQVEQKIKEVIARIEKQKVDSQQEVPLQEAVIEQQRLIQEKEELTSKLLEKEQDSEKLRLLTVRNLELEQQVTNLEIALKNAIEKSIHQNTDKNNEINTLYNQTAIEATIAQKETNISLLTSEIGRLHNIISSIKTELAYVKTINQNQQEKIKRLSEDELSKSEIKSTEDIIASFGEVGEHVGWSGWSRRGYRTSTGVLHTGISAIAAFVSDVTQEHQYQT